jgi:hypothetical protein
MKTGLKKCNREDETECGKKARISNLLLDD